MSITTLSPPTDTGRRGELGRLAGTRVPHEFVAIAPTAGAPQCRECFGWTDDVRHYGGPRG